ncbi:cation:proton antiporter [Amycolatopsis keratiniphila]|uniref:Sodium/hydrogen exchanger n=1 Tax=Amycolatopsis keratiniphila TaxID=129921 RepID=R4T4G2_9PSEU|nr:cation:proton antiporter [Amycolatopsis keratiniphila]AGM05882.1 sodium/hydrogen exchanger [Amycolatopsis keratiniphila]
MLLVPLLTYTATVAIDGNGFVASFVCGVTFRYVHRLAKARQIHRSPAGRDLVRAGALDEDFRLLEDFTSLLTMTLWFVVGVSAVLAFSAGLPWQVALFCFAAITVIRIIPVQLSLAGSALSHRERLQVGLLGPRGTSSSGSSSSIASPRGRSPTPSCSSPSPWSWAAWYCTASVPALP